MIKKLGGEGGYTVVEMAISAVVLSVVMISFLSLYTGLVSSSRYAKFKAVALTLGTNQMEYLKSLPYDQLAVVGGSITATTLLPSTTTKTIDGFTYVIKNDIDYADDSFDGCASYPTTSLAQKYCRNYPAPTGSPVDTNPKDYKVVDVTVYRQTDNKQLANVSTNVSARVAETSSNTGAMLITVIDDQGNPVPSADVNVTNSSITPSINQTETTDINGIAIFYDLPPDTTNYDYVITASKTNYSTISTLVPTGSLQPYFPNQQIILQQSSFLTMIIKPKGSQSLLVETVTESNAPLASAKINIKGGYKKYNSATDTTYYYDAMSPSDIRSTTDASGLFSLQNLTPGSYLFCGDAGATSCSVGATTYYLAAALPYSGSNPFYPVDIPTFVTSSPPATTYSYGGNNYLQKVKLMLTTSATFPRIKSLAPDDASRAASNFSAFTFTITGTNLPCSATAASCSTVVRIKQASSVFTASCSGTSGAQIDCIVDLTGAVDGATQLEVVANGQTLTTPVGVLGGINVAP